MKLFEKIYNSIFMTSLSEKTRATKFLNMKQYPLSLWVQILRTVLSTRPNYAGVSSHPIT